MKKFTTWLLFLAMLVSCLALTGCGAKDEKTPAPAEGVEAAPAAKTVNTDLADMTWDEVLAEAKGQTVNWYAWGGSQPVNNFIKDVIIPRAAEYGVTLNWVTVSNITDAINITMAEKQAGMSDKGEVDMLWINGGNFMTAQQAGILFGPWAEQVENAKYVDWTSPAINTDLGFPVNGMESPWAATIKVSIYDSAKISLDECPKTLDEMSAWIKANPGKFSYCPPPVFAGTRLIKEYIYSMIGPEVLEWDASTMSQDEFYEKTKPVWDMLAELHPYMWQEGKNFPKDMPEMDKLFSNGELAFSYIFSGTGIAGKVNEGTYPVSSRGYCYDQSLGDTNYLAITYDSDNKAGAMVVSNIILDPEVQAIAARDISFGSVLDMSKLSEEQKKAYDDAVAAIDPNYYIPPTVFTEKKIPEFSGAFNSYIEAIWAELFLN